MKMKCKRRWAAFGVMLLLAYSLAGCTTPAADLNSQGVSDESSTTFWSEGTNGTAAGSYSTEDLDDRWDSASSTLIALDGTSANVEGNGATANGSSVTITDEGTYIISGTLDDGQIIVDAGKEQLVRLVLNGVQLSCSSSAPIYAKQAGKTVIILAEGTENVVSDGSEYVYPDDTTDEPDAAIFSKSDLSINGSGSLTVSGNYKNGIGTKDNLVITNGVLQITSANDALRGRDSISIQNGTFTLTSKGDALKSNNDEDPEKGKIFIDGGSFNITSENDGIQAETVLQISAGSFDITTGGGSANAVHTQQESGFPGGNGGPRGDGGFGRPGNRPEANAAPKADSTNPSNVSDRAPADMPAPPSDMQNNAPVTAGQEETESISTKALKAGTQLVISGGDFQIDALDDAVHSNGDVTITGGNFEIATGDDGFHADSALVIDNGTIHISQSYEGLEGATVTVNGGSINLLASDDGINAAGGSDTATGAFSSQDSFRSDVDYTIRITGGYIVIDAAGDGIDSNQDIYLEGGTVLVNGPTGNGDGALDFDGSCEISGGILVAAGSSGMLQAPDETSTQHSLTILFTEVQKSGTLVNLTDEDGISLLSYAPVKDYQSIVISTPDLAQGKTYTISTGGSDNGENNGGLYTGGTYSEGVVLTQVTLLGARTIISSTGEATTLGSMSGGPSFRR